MIDQVRNLMKLRREVSDIVKEIDRFIEEFRDVDKSLEEVCIHGSVAVQCTPMGCIVHILDGSTARITILVKHGEAAVIDWSRCTYAYVVDGEVDKLISDVGAERDLRECISGYMMDIENRLTKLKAMLALINIA
jgi:hypothetical protein